MPHQPKLPFHVRRGVCALAIGLGLLAGPSMAQTSAELKLNGVWSFALAPNETAADGMANFYKPGYDTSAFKPTPVPSNWAVQGFEGPHYKPFGNTEASQGFYLTHFTPPADFDGKRILLKFGGVWSSAEVWLNGRPLGRHDSGFTSFAYDVTSALKSGADNVLAVRVRQTQHDYLFDTNDDWTLGGIYRDVSLEAMPKLRSPTSTPLSPASPPGWLHPARQARPSAHRSITPSTIATISASITVISSRRMAACLSAMS